MRSLFIYLFVYCSSPECSPTPQWLKLKCGKVSGKVFLFDWQRCLLIVKAVSRHVFTSGQLWWCSHTLWMGWRSIPAAAVWGLGRGCVCGCVYACTCIHTSVYWRGILLPHLQITHPQGGLPPLSSSRMEKWEIIKGWIAWSGKV